MADTKKKSADTQVLMGVFALPARLALRLKTPLKDLKRLLELAVFGEARGDGLKLATIAKRLGVSVPKVSLLSRDFKDHFAAPEEEFGLKRRILRLLWAQPLTQRRLVKALGDVAEEAEVVQALQALLAEGRVEEVPGRTMRYRVSATLQRMVEDRWLARLDALANMMQAHAEIIEARFFDGDARAFARTIQLDVVPEDIERLFTHYRESLFPLLAEMDERSEGRDDAVTVHISLAWAPDKAFRAQHEEDHNADEQDT